MRRKHDEFPAVERLWRGCILAGIANAISGVDPEFQFLWHRWHGPTYVVDREQADYGVIVFGELVAGFLYSKSSRRNPGPTGPYDPNWYLVGMPPAARALGETYAFSHLNHRDFGRGFVPIFTAAFWSEGDHLAAAEPWEQVMKHGRNVIDDQLLDIDAALPEIAREVGLTLEQPPAVRSLWERRVVSRDAVVVVEPWERALITAETDAGIDWTRTQLAKIGIVLP